jgi:hypothetical protein
MILLSLLWITLLNLLVLVLRTADVWTCVNVRSAVSKWSKDRSGANVRSDLYGNLLRVRPFSPLVPRLDTKIILTTVDRGMVSMNFLWRSLEVQERREDGEWGRNVSILFILNLYNDAFFSNED